MFLYHGTSEKIAKKVLKTGIIPRENRSGNWKVSVESNKNAVYLTNSALALHYANVVSKNDTGAIIEINVSKLKRSLFFADEDAAEYHLTNEGPTQSNDPKQFNKRIAYFRNNLKTIKFNWEDSLNVYGTCTYFGSIPVSAMTRVLYIPKKARNLIKMSGFNVVFGMSLIRDQHIIKVMFQDTSPSGRFTMTPQKWEEYKTLTKVVKLR